MNNSDVGTCIFALDCKTLVIGFEYQIFPIGKPSLKEFSAFICRFGQIKIETTCRIN